MDKEENINLDQLLIEEGKRMLKVLDSTDIKPSSALWFYLEEQKVWRLIIASPYFNNLSAQDRYRRLIGIFNQEAFTRLEVGSIVLLPADDPLISLLKIAVRTNPDSISEISFKSNTVNGVFIYNSLIYRLS